MKTSISIVGSCVSNGAIQRGTSLHTNNYLVKGAITLVQSFSLITEAIPGIMDLFDDLDFSNEMYRLSGKITLNKDLQGVIRGNWLIVDLVSLKNPLWELIKGEKTYLFSPRPIIDKRKNERALRKWIKEHGYTIHEINNPILEMEFDQQCRFLSSFFDKIIACMQEKNKLIFLRAGFIRTRMHKDGSIQFNGFGKDTDKLNERFLELEEFIISKQPEMHVIEFPANCYTDGNGHLNESPTHYPMQVYEYYLQSIDIITDQKDSDQEKKLLEEKRNDCSNVLMEMMNEALKTTTEVLTRYRNSSTYELYRAMSYKQKEEYIQGVYSRYFTDPMSPIPFREAATINEYTSEVVHSANNGDYLLFLAVRDDASVYYKKWENYQLLGLTLSLANHIGKSYVAIVDFERGITREGFKNSNEELIMRHSVISKNCHISGDYLSEEESLPEVSHVLISSKAKNKEDSYVWAKILINNIDYSLDKQGMNIVVFSKSLSRVVDSFYVNFHNDSKVLIRRK